MDEEKQSVKRELESEGPTEGQDAEGAKRQKVEEYTRDASATEQDVWIVEYVNKGCVRGNAVLKSRFSDFVVREVWDDDVCRLGSTAAEGSSKSDDPVALIPLGCEELKKLGVSNERVAALEEKLHKKSANMPDKLTLTLVDTPLTKEQRTAVHKTIKAYFPKITSFVEDGSIMVKRIQESDKARSKWPRTSPGHVQFTLYKENMETMSCLKALTTKLGVSQKTITTSGTKDKRAITVQRATAFHVTPERLAGLNKSSFGKASVVKVGDFSYRKEGIRLGMHSGNRFSIVLRGFTGNTDEVKRTVEQVAANGFLNYFGLQRFGSTSTPTYAVASAMLEGKLRKAFDILFQSKAEVVKEFQQAVDIWKAGDGKDVKQLEAMLDLTPHWCPVERSLIMSLMSSGGNMRQAFDGLNRNTRSLYFHALQSVVWNELASKRIALGNTPKAGDLVKHGAGMAILAEKDVGNFTMSDVMLPLPGADPKLMFPEVPECNRGAFVECLKKYSALPLLGEGECSVPLKEFNLYGSYRPLVCRANDITWSTTPYTDDEETLQVCEFDRDTSTLRAPESCIAGFDEPPPKTEGDKTALRLSFTLRTGSYATMCMREIVHLTATN